MYRPKVRSAEELQFMHDMLKAVMTEPDLNVFSQEVLSEMAMTCDVLCWCLHHDHNTLFEVRMKRLKDFIESQGQMRKLDDDTEDKSRLN